MSLLLLAGALTIDIETNECYVVVKERRQRTCYGRRNGRKRVAAGAAFRGVSAWRNFYSRLALVSSRGTTSRCTTFRGRTLELFKVSYPAWLAGWRTGWMDGLLADWLSGRYTTRVRLEPARFSFPVGLTLVSHAKTARRRRRRGN